MTSGNLKRADYPLLCSYRHYPAVIKQVKALLSIASLCFLILFFASCGQPSDGQSSHASGPKRVGRTSNAQITYVAIGASETFGIGTAHPYTQNWPFDLAALLGPNVHLINLGIPGIRVQDALRIELPVALDSHPDLVTIWLGVNDIAAKVPVSSFANDLNTLLTRLRANSPHARIAIANIPDLTLLPAFGGADQQLLSQQIQAYNTAIAGNAQQHQAILIDLTTQNYNLQAHPDYISSDGLHPTDIGYQQLAKLFYQALQHQ